MMLFWLFGGGKCIFMAKSTKNLHCLSPPLLFLSYNPTRKSLDVQFACSDLPGK
jgi:hypothetical protein